MTKFLLLALFTTACRGPREPAPMTTGGCPEVVIGSVARAYPGSTARRCKAEHEDGKDLFEVALSRVDGTTAEVEVTPSGAIVALEEVVPATALPEAVGRAFAVRYPDARPSRVERITPTGQRPWFEITFGGKEASFSETGEFREEEGRDGEPD